MPKIIIDITDPYYSIEETYPLLGISRMTLFRWLKRNKIYALRIADRVLIPKIEIERLRLKVCSTCYHNQNSLCSCREKADMITKPGKCPDWHLKNS